MTEETGKSFYETGRPGIRGWIFSTDHKRIGLLYLTSMLTFFTVGVCLGLTMRLQLMFPGHSIVPAHVYNSLYTLHGVIMIFLFVIPGLPAVFGNFMLPLMLGAEDVAFPRINLLSWWLFVTGAGLALLTIFFGGLPDTGWTFYAPYSIRSGQNVSLAVFAAFILGFSSILTGLNFVVTIHRLRAKGMGWFKMPLFAWGLYATGWIQILATPVVGITLLLILVERIFHIGLFDPTIGGDPVLYQHLFWIYSHPAVYIMILPAMGAISEIVPTFSRRTIFGYKMIAFSSMAIAIVGYLVWGHHMFTSGMSNTARAVFSLLTFLVAIPTAVKVFNWLATLYKGSIVLQTPLLFALSFIFLFSIGGFTGLIQGALSTDIHLHDTTFIVAHFHYTMFGGTGFAFFGALHYWFPKMFGRMYKEKPAKLGWLLMFLGFNFLYFPLFIAGFMGQPRRYYDYLPKFAVPNLVSTIGSWILVAGLIVLAVNLIRALRFGEKAPANPWKAATLEWETSSPPPLENFVEPPVVTQGPYDFVGKGLVKG
ncbi:MAG: cytochrome c oxidase subunit I [Candidatus Hydrogenedentota bacterium]|nr:MAG: cytochrome c oxidase subunit I [Candidatus Hydrogenedentota bacterium]